MIGRRRFSMGIAVYLFCAPLAVDTQQAGKVPRVGVLFAGSRSDPAFQRAVDAFQQGLVELGYVEGRSIAIEYREAQDAARALGVRLQPLEVRDPTEFEKAFAAMTRERAGALLVLSDSTLLTQRERIADLAAKSRLPAVSGMRAHAEAGGLIAYGANIFDIWRRAATYVDKILKGAKPGDLPVEQPTKFELVINLKTAKALGLTIPQALLIRADEIIQ